MVERFIMNFRFAHNNFNVLSLEKSLDFYKKALNLEETQRYEEPDNSFKLVFLGDGKSEHRLELTWMAERKEPYNLGDNEFHLAFTTDDFEKAHELHERMGCICYENRAMGIYFIKDPDGYWIEILPSRRNPR
jgi:lactoylglutathione lyase